MEWESCLKISTLNELAGKRSFDDGVSYYRNNAVAEIREEDERITASVRGTRKYQVTLDLDENDMLCGNCSCPYGEDGNFCKHCVAVGIAFLNREASKSVPVNKMKTQTLGDYVESMSKEGLVALVKEMAETDSNLKRRLEMKMSSSSQQGPDVMAYRKMIKKELEVRDYFEADETVEFSNRVDKIILSLQDLFESGHVEAARELVAYSIEKLDGVFEFLDDEGGYVESSLSELYKLQLEVAIASKNDPTELAEYLFERALKSGEEGTVDWQTQLPKLDEASKTQFQELVEAKWKTFEPLIPKQQSGSWDSERHIFTSILVAFAQLKGDISAEIEIKKRDLHAAKNFLEIAKLYQNQNDETSALKWAEKGRDAFNEDPFSVCHGFLAERYIELGRFEEVYRIFWDRFLQTPMLPQYVALHEASNPRGEWNAWREKCWKTLRERVAASRSEPDKRHSYYREFSDHSEIVEILLWENRDGEAWEEANRGGCTRAFWLRLAGTRELDNPEDAIRIYQEEIKLQVEATKNEAYETAMRYILIVRGIMNRTQRTDQFKRYFESLRAEFKRKRNFMALLERSRV